MLILVSDAGIKPGTTDGGVCQAVYCTIPRCGPRHIWAQRKPEIPRILQRWQVCSIHPSIYPSIHHLMNISLCESSGTECRRCCDPAEEAPQYASPNPQYNIVPQINITILKGTKHVKIYFNMFSGFGLMRWTSSISRIIVVQKLTFTERLNLFLTHFDCIQLFWVNVNLSLS